MTEIASVEIARQSASSIALKTAIPGPRSLALSQRRNAAVADGVGCHWPVFAHRGEGAILEDVDGNRFLDFAGGIGCLNTGHAPAEVVKAVTEQAGRFLHTCFMVTPYESYVELAEKLNAAAPGTFKKKTALFNSGAEAIENAVKIARLATGRQAVISFHDAFHGRTQLAMSLTSKTHPYKAGFGPFAPEVYHLPYAYCYRCEYNLRYPECKVHCARKLEDFFIREIAAESVAAILFEPILGEGGFVVPPKEWFDVIGEICRRHKILLIADEVQTGFGRTGAIFACEKFNFEPDILVTAKSLSAGMPLGAVTGRAEIMDACSPGQLGGTFGGNPIACAAALASWEIMETQRIPERAETFGRIFQSYAEDWYARFELIGDVRGLGAMRALELVKSRETRVPAKEETTQVLAACQASGLLIISAGTYGNVVRILLPLVASEDQMHEGLQILGKALQEVQGRRS